MGVYPRHDKLDVLKHENGCETWEETRSEPGIVYTRQVIATKWEVKERTDCFCCSCHEHYEGGEVRDPHCRNHGFAGRRPCLVHEMPGAVDDECVMPTSVQAEQERSKVLNEKERARFQELRDGAR